MHLLHASNGCKYVALDWEHFESDDCSKKSNQEIIRATILLLHKCPADEIGMVVSE